MRGLTEVTEDLDKAERATKEAKSALETAISNWHLAKAKRRLEMEVEMEQSGKKYSQAKIDAKLLVEESEGGDIHDSYLRYRDAKNNLAKCELAQSRLEREYWDTKNNR